MIAQIKYDDKEFYSYIFFLCIYEYRTKAIVFNDLENKFELLNAYKNKYTSEAIINLFDYKEDGMIKKDEMQLTSCTVNDCMGYEWLINNEQLIKDIEQGNKIPEEYLKKGKELNSTIDLFKWHDITNEEEAEELMDISGGFHDSYIREIKGIFGRPYEPEFETKYQVSFELYGNHFDIMMEFYDGVTINYTLNSHLNDIYLSCILFHEGSIYWLDGSDELLPIDIKDYPYISARKLRWKIIPKAEND